MPEVTNHGVKKMVVEFCQGDFEALVPPTSLSSSFFPLPGAFLAAFYLIHTFLVISVLLILHSIITQ